MTLTLAEAAARLRISKRTVMRLTASGVLPIIRLSQRRVGIPDAAVEAYEREGGWRSASSRMAGSLSSYSWAEKEFLDDCQRSPPKPTRRPLKPESGASCGNVVPLADRMNRR